MFSSAALRGDYRVLDQRVVAAEKHIDELRRGAGYITKDRLTLIGEYP
jgi:hypothetical protein